MPYIPKYNQQTIIRRILPAFLAFSLSLGTFPMALADVASDHQNGAGTGPIDPNQINQTYNGSIINPGSYYNTNTGATTFVNTSGGGLWLQGGTVNGYQVGSNNAVNGNGGNINIYAPGSVVRLDGNINVSGILNNGSLGSGGQVNITSAYLYQNGQIYADGSRGGLVQVNVDNLSMGSQALISAKGLGGNSSDSLNGAGGAVKINANGVVDIANRAMIVTDGKVVGNYDTNVIAIEGALIRNAGTLSANGVVIDGAASQGGTIRLVANGVTGQTAAGLDTLIANANIRNNTPGDTGFNNAISQARNLLNGQTGSITNSGTVQANGASNSSAAPITTGNAGDGGNILLTAAGNLTNSGTFSANGGNGGNSSLIINGGNGGAISADATGNIQNSGTVQANGGNGSTNTANVQGTVTQSSGPVVTSANSGPINLNQNKSTTFTSSTTVQINQPQQTLASGTTIAPSSFNVQATYNRDGSVTIRIINRSNNAVVYERIQRPSGNGNNWTASDNATVTYQVRVNDPLSSSPQFVNLTQRISYSFNLTRPIVQLSPVKPVLLESASLNSVSVSNSQALVAVPIKDAVLDVQSVKVLSLQPKITLNVGIDSPAAFDYNIRPVASTSTNVIADASGFKGGNGGSGGLLAFGAGGTITNTGTIRANGGNGGNGGKANANNGKYITDIVKSVATGGDGGNGGQGGLIVFSGNPSNAILGSGNLQANGGAGGVGGNAVAYANAKNTLNTRLSNLNSSSAVAVAYAGKGGRGGAAGTVVTPNGSTNSQRYSAKAGGNGASGIADADAWAASQGRGQVTAKAFAGLSDGSILVSNSRTTTGSVSQFSDYRVSGQSALVGSNNAVLRTQESEVLSHNNLLVILSRASGNTSLGYILDGGKYRTVNNPTDTRNGAFNSIVNSISTGNINHFQFFNPVASSINLTTTGLGGFAGLTNRLNSASILSNGSLSSSSNWNLNSNRSGGEISFLSNNGGITLSNNSVSANGSANGGSIVLKAGNGSVTLRNSQLNATGTSNLGGIIRITATDRISVGALVDGSTGGINANGGLLGGNISLTTPGTILNTGTISANATSGSNAYTRGGRILLNGSQAVVNTGSVAANGGRIGGSINLLSNQLVANLGTGSSISANGSNQGGTIRLIAGDTNAANNNQGLTLPADIIAALGTSSSVSGVGITQTTSPVTLLGVTYNPLLRESVLNNGSISTTGGNGKITLAGNNQVALGVGSSLNGVAFNASLLGSNTQLATLIAAIRNNASSVKIFAGQNINTNPGGEEPSNQSALTLANADSNLTGATFTNIDSTEFAFPVSTTNTSDPTATTLFGLFQPDRLNNQTISSDTNTNSGASGQIAFAQSAMFLAKNYSSVTQNILEQAAINYNKVLSATGDKSDAASNTETFLKEAGIDAEVATGIINQIQQGTLKAAPEIQGLLSKIVAESQTAMN
ncbi:MAG: hypothetical protein K2X01_04695 [Cyanobacteria bacterium]|nr:hypothetical protein [Cyanobacteriota bacterium]